jgi:cell division protein FtsB
VKKFLALLLVIICLLQYRIWFGDGNIFELRRLQARIDELNAEKERRLQRNAALDAEVRDLKGGYEAVEELARQNLGMIKPGEIRVQVFEAEDPPPPAPNGQKKTAGEHQSPHHRAPPP